MRRGGRRRGREQTPAAEAVQRRRRWPFTVVAVLVAAGAFVLLSRRAPRTDAEARSRLLGLRPAPGSLNLVVVTLDTLRADRLGCYGFRGVETPVIDGLAREGVLFEQVSSTVPLTFPAHSSIFTGLVPPHHGVRDNGGFFLDEARTTLAERMKAAGYATGAFVAAWVLESRWGLAQGFDHYSDKFDLSQYKVVSLGTVQKRGEEVMRDALAWIDTVRERRFFAWVHLYDPHTPYDAPEPFRTRYRGQPYVGEVAYSDEVVGRLVAHLRARDLLDRTVLVITADHGESLGDHGESTHAYFVYDATTAVPLIVRTPWALRGRVRTQASLVDVFPTLLDLMGLAPEPGIDGLTLSRALFAAGAELEHVAYSETYFPRYHFGWQHLRAMRDGRFKFVDAPQPELYDLSADPGETRNVYKSESKRAAELRRRMEGLVGETRKAAPERQGLDPETLQRLAALGYVGNVVDVDPTAVLPDPKDKIGLFRSMNQAKAAAQDEKVGDAIAKMQKVLAEDPRIMDAWLTLGNWLSKEGRGEDAIEAYKSALALKPDDEVAMLNLANAYRARGKPDDDLAALEIFRGTVKVNPKNPQAWYQLATLYLDLGREPQADATFREALQSNPKMGAAYNALGALAYQRGRLDEAERLIRQGLALEPDVRTGRFNLARILEDRGKRAEAEALYREELEVYPDHGRSHFNLAQIARVGGDREGYLGGLRRCIDQAAQFGPCYFYLSREELGAGRLESAADLARRGLESDPRSPVAPLGHYVLADVYNRQGQPARAREEVARARRIELSLQKAPQPRPLD